MALLRACSERHPPTGFPGKEIHFIEFGVGGGVNQQGTQKATTAAEAAYYPFFGIYGSYRYSRVWGGKGELGLSGNGGVLRGRPVLLQVPWLHDDMRQAE